jgi:CBS domain-containing protein
MPRSILTEKIARRGRHILQEYTVDPFEFLQASQVMSAEPETLPETMTIAAAIAFFGSEARHRSYPVVDGNGLLQGLVSRSDVLGWRLGAFEDNISLAEVLGDVSQPHANPRDPVARVADLMVETGVGRIPVVGPASGKVVGILTRHDLLKIRHVHRGSEVTRSRGTPTHQQDR